MYSDKQILGIVLLSCAAWGITTHYINKSCRHISKEGRSRIVSVLHALASISANAYSAYKLKEQGGYFGCSGGELQTWVQSISAGYFLVDLVGILTSEYFDWLYIGHHLISITATTYGMYGIGALENALCTVLLEGANPFLHTRWLLIELKKTNTWLYKFFNIGFLCDFTIMRFIWGPWMLYQVCAAPLTPVFFKITGILFFIFSSQFAYDVVTKIRRGEVWIKQKMEGKGVKGFP